MADVRSSPLLGGLGESVKSSSLARAMLHEFFFFIMFVRGYSHNILLTFSQSYIEYDLRKNKIVIPFFRQPINFYELIVRF
jgi:hypothetical protein